MGDKMKFLQLLLITTLCLSGYAEAAKKKKSKKKTTPVTLVKNVTGESSDAISLVTISLSEALKDKKSVTLTEHGRYIQIDIAGVSAAKPGSFYEANSPFLNKMALFETDKNSTALRIFSEEDTSILSKVAELDVLENRIILSLDHRVLQSKLKGSIDQQTADSFVDQLEKMSSEDANKIAVTADAVPTAPVSKKQEKIKTAAELGVGKTSFDLAKNLRKVAAFLGGLFVLLILALTFKRFKRNAFLAQKSSQDALKTLGTLSLNPKQQLNLVEVGGEKILLSVSNDAVSLISHIGQKAESAQPALGPASSETVERKLLGGSAASSANSGFPETLKALRKKAREIESSQTIPRAPMNRFDEAIEKGEEFKPKTKSASKTTPAGAPKKAAKRKTGTKINVAVGDDGAKKVAEPKTQDEAIKDVTSLIRKKLKDLPKF
jgi:flagellar biogenesis protein FliO